MTAAESEKIGALIEANRASERRLAAIEKWLAKLDEKLDVMQEHVAPVAAQLAKELASYRVEEAKWKVEVVGPLRDEVKHLSARLSDEQVLDIDKEERHRNRSSFRRWLLPFLATLAFFGTQILIALFLSH